MRRYNMLCAVLVAGWFRSKGNPVKIRGCPAAVSENEPAMKHWSA